MERALKILAYAVILFMTYLLITAILKTCNKDNNEVASSNEDFSSGDSETYENDYFEDGPDSTEDRTDDFWDRSKGEGIDKSKDIANDKSSIPSSEVYYTTPSGDLPSSKNVTDNATDLYMVIAGNYIINSNAENMALKLKRMGYENAEIVIFDQSQYYTVVASRSANYNKALTIATDLKSQGVDSYVHTRKE